MNEFVLLYRGADRPTSPEDGQSIMQKWMEWFKDLAAQGKLIDRGQPLEMGGKVLQPASKTVVDGPFAEAKDIVGGFSLIKAADLDEATELAKGCPVLERGGTVEVRPIMQLNI